MENRFGIFFDKDDVEKAMYEDDYYYWFSFIERNKGDFGRVFNTIRIDKDTRIAIESTYLWNSNQGFTLYIVNTHSGLETIRLSVIESALIFSYILDRLNMESLRNKADDILRNMTYDIMDSSYINDFETTIECLCRILECCYTPFEYGSESEIIDYLINHYID